MASSPQSDTRRVLVLADPAGLANSVLETLRAGAEVVITESREAFDAAFRSEIFDLVIAPGGDVVASAQRVAREQRHTLLDGIGHGVCVVDPAGTPLWANAALRSYSDEVVEFIRSKVGDLARELVNSVDHSPRRRAYLYGQEYYFEMTAAPLLDPQGQIERVVGLVYDTTAISRMRTRLDAIDAAGRELVALDVDATARLDVSERLHLLEDRLIRYCRELLEFNHFAVMVLDPTTNRLDAVLSGGFPDNVAPHDIFARKEGNGISGYVAATGQSFICPDVTQSPLYLQGYEHARSSLTVPLRLVDRVVGVLNVEADELDAFTEEDRQVAEIFARYVAVALHTLKLLAAERSEVTGEVTADVRAELARPLNEIVAHSTRLLQGVSAADAQERLRAIIEEVDAAKRSLHVAAQSPALRGLSTDRPPVIDPLLEEKRVLIADDEEIIRETISDVLSKAGALTVMARDGEEAVTMIAAQHFDLVLSDIKMPQRNGYEVFAAAKAANPACQVILITGFGYDPEHSIVRASREGLAGVLFKPFRVEQLFDLIRKALAE